ncbi:esterase [Variovorax sp. UC122_21]|uniref:esterase n=1 Tax=Variovorax sp. UC122_21 TaxID=3374554 RepID=UPI003756D232
MKRIRKVAATAAAVCIAAALPAQAQVLKEFGSFHVGGRQVTLDGYPVTESVFTQGAKPTRVDPNGDFEVEQMYVQYLVPEPTRAKYPLLMWHGGGLTGVTWDTKPDGQPGWMQYFFRQGHPVYVSDAVERGRASWARYPEIFKGPPFFRTKKEAWETFRMGPEGSYSLDPAKRTAYPEGKFPGAYLDQFAKQFVPRWTVNDGPTLAAYNAEIQKVGPAVVMVHSQAGNFGFQAALAAPDKLRAVIAIEPAGAPPPGPALDSLKNIPMLIIWGDNVDKQEIWIRQQPASRAFADDLNARGGKVEWIDLPKIGIRGNSHMTMMDTNSDQIAALIQDWMKRNGLMR